MTHTQWLFEYYSLLKHDEEQRKIYVEDLEFQLKAFRYLLVKVFGLDMLVDQDADASMDDLKYLPLIWSVARPDVLEEMQKKLAERDAFKKSVESGDALPDEEFDKMSSAIANDELGDMEPMIDFPTPSPQELWNSQHNQDKLRALGVQLVNGPVGSNAPHFKVDVDNINKKLSEANIQRAAARRDVESMLKEEANTLRARGVKVTFDDK